MYNTHAVNDFIERAEQYDISAPGGVLIKGMGRLIQKLDNEVNRLNKQVILLTHEEEYYKNRSYLVIKFPRFLRRRKRDQ